MTGSWHGWFYEPPRRWDDQAATEQEGLVVIMEDAGIEPDQWCWICGQPWLLHRSRCSGMRVTPDVYAAGHFAPAPRAGAP